MSRSKYSENPLFGPFIAVNGGTTIRQTDDIISAFNSELTIETHKPVLGFLASFSTFTGSNTFRDSRYPNIKDLPLLLRNVKERVCTVISYKTDFSHFYSEIETILTYQNIYESGLCNGIKLNTAWPLVEEIRKIREHFSGVEIIIRVSTQMSGNQLGAKEAASRAAKYFPHVDYVFIDKPNNQELDHSLDLFNEMKSQGFPDIGFGGAIYPDSAPLLMESLRNGLEKHRFSIQIQDGARDRENTPSNSISESTLNMEKVRSFIRSTSMAFSQSQVSAPIY
jgi:hypothetical protein